MRDCCAIVLRARARSPGERYPAPPGPGDSKIAPPGFLLCSNIAPALDRASQLIDNHDRNHPARWRASRPDSKNPRCSDRLDAAVETCVLRNCDFEDGATKCAHNRSPFSGENGLESPGGVEGFLPLTLILSPRNGERWIRGVARSHNEFDGRLPSTIDWNARNAVALDLFLSVRSAGFPTAILTTAALTDELIERSARRSRRSSNRLSSFQMGRTKARDCCAIVLEARARIRSGSCTTAHLSLSQRKRTKVRDFL